MKRAHRIAVVVLLAPAAGEAVSLDPLDLVLER
jgi:hypothetical protein